VIIKGFFFDLDGTLVDTLESNYRAYSQAIQDVLNVTPDSKLRELIKSGASSAVFLPAVLPSATEAELYSIMGKKREYYPDHLHASTLNTYLSDFLRHMSQHYTTVLVTTAKEPNALAVLRAHDLTDYFHHMIFGHDVDAMKPDPEAYHLALKKTGLRAEEVIAFEDSPKGLKAAEAAGIRVVQIRNFL
jgi:beta-phosphoglucomutase